MNKFTIEKLGDTFIQTVFCCKQPNGEYVSGITWTVQGTKWKPYSPSELPETIDKGLAMRRFPAKDWRKAKKYADDLCATYGLSCSY